MTSAAFFTRCYDLRSDLVHGNMPLPTYEVLSQLVGTLEVFVSDLLTIPILGDLP